MQSQQRWHWSLPSYTSAGRIAYGEWMAQGRRTDGLWVDLRYCLRERISDRGGNQCHCFYPPALVAIHCFRGVGRQVLFCSLIPDHLRAYGRRGEIAPKNSKNSLRRGSLVAYVYFADGQNLQAAASSFLSLRYVDGRFRFVWRGTSRES